MYARAEEMSGRNDDGDDGHSDDNLPTYRRDAAYADALPGVSLSNDDAPSAVGSCTARPCAGRPGLLCCWCVPRAGRGVPP